MATVKINVLRAFRFTAPANREKGEPLPVEKLFTVGEHEISQAMADHPWMAAGADGCIESKAQAKARMDAAAKRAAAEKLIADNATAQAQAAEDRRIRQEPARVAKHEETEADLNTPVGVLRARMGASDTTIVGKSVTVEQKTAPAVKAKSAETHRKPPAKHGKHGRSAHA